MCSARRNYKRKCNKVRASGLLTVFLCLFPTVAFAARPLPTDDAWTLEQGKFQIEIGFDGIRQENHDREYSPSLTVTYSLSQRMQGWR